MGSGRAAAAGRATPRRSEQVKRALAQQESAAAIQQPSQQRPRAGGNAERVGGMRAFDMHDRDHVIIIKS